MNAWRHERDRLFAVALREYQARLEALAASPAAEQDVWVAQQQAQHVALDIAQLGKPLALRQVHLDPATIGGIFD